MSQVRSLNRVILVGRTGKDPEVTVMASSGRQLAKFSLATNEGYFDKNSNAWKDLPTEWHNIVAWGPLAQKVEKGVGKGDMVLVEGSIRTRKWKDKNGQDRSTTDIQADNIIVLDRRKDGGSPAPPIPTTVPAPATPSRRRAARALPPMESRPRRR